MLVFGAILPHSAVLLPTVGKENLKKAKKTLEALEKIRRDFDAAKPDSVIIISSHAGNKEHFSLYANDEYLCNFEALGDFATKLAFEPSFPTLALLRKIIRIKGFPLALKGDKKLNYDFMAPLFYLNGGKSGGVRIAPLETANLPLKNNFDCGDAIREEILKSEKRIAVIASANLSHALETESPGGFSPAGKEFDAKIQEILMTKNAAGLMLYGEEKLKEAKECGSHQIAMLLGIFQQTDYKPEIYSYEAPFGVGFLVANLKI